MTLDDYMTLCEIEGLTKEFADALKILFGRTSQCESEKAAVVARHINGINDSLCTAKDKKDALCAAILSAPELFRYPRTRFKSGLKVGLMKGKGKLEIDDEAKTIALIREHLAESAELLIDLQEKPSKNRLRQLSADELEKIGARITDTDDHVVINTADIDIDKLIKALMKDDEAKSD